MCVRLIIHVAETVKRRKDMLLMSFHLISAERSKKGYKSVRRIKGEDKGGLGILITAPDPTAPANCN